MTERWGIKGERFRQIRPMRNREFTYGWAYELASPRHGSKRYPHTPTAVDVYRDSGDGWVLVEHIPVGAAKP